jgi:hypothetical protein
MPVYVRDSDVERRLNEAVQAAEDAFWSEVARSFPEATHGDFGPDETVRRDHFNFQDVLSWLRWNAPELVYEA